PLDGRCHLLEGTALAGQRVLDAHGRPGLDVTLDDALSLQLLEPGGERLGPHPAGALLELAEAQGPVLQEAQDQAGPRARQQGDRLLVGGAMRVDSLTHPGAILPHLLSDGKGLDTRYLDAYIGIPRVVTAR